MIVVSLKMSPGKLFLLILFIFTVLLKPSLAARYRIIDRGLLREHRYLTEIGYTYSGRILIEASEFVLETFHQKPYEGRNYDHVILTFKSFSADKISSASTSGNNIRINTDYLQVYTGDLKEEFAGILYHESTRVWQWNSNGTAPEGLISGVADYVRLKAGKPAKGWPGRGSGWRWDEGHAVTAYFLEYCEGLRTGFIADLNAKLRGSYSDDFFVDLLGNSVYGLWSDYKLSHKTQRIQPVSGSGFLAESDYNRKILKSQFRVEFNGVLEITWIPRPKGRVMDPGDSTTRDAADDCQRLPRLPHKAQIDSDLKEDLDSLDEDENYIIARLNDLMGRLETLLDVDPIYFVLLAIMIVVAIPAVASCYYILQD
ncbi:uncharacterized protein LOC116203550 [Punica granatum]|uniref:Uncharacterized protein LOC116203550 n=2 Tax=Punica granatum TaxID=22663 RepID=A0A6P8D249_PUNGR|nr:uncharacterized protein LOC116203550 [Punica granatum]